VRRELGAMTAILNGIDALAFCGGIGENAWHIREKVCTGLDWLGLELDHVRNRAGEFVISSEASRVTVFVVKTNEEAMIAQHTLEILGVTSRDEAATNARHAGPSQSVGSVV
jgi:acetate kinase